MVEMTEAELSLAVKELEFVADKVSDCKLMPLPLYTNKKNVRRISEREMRKLIYDNYYL